MPGSSQDDAGAVTDEFVVDVVAADGADVDAVEPF